MFRTIAPTLRPSRSHRRRAVFTLALVLFTLLAGLVRAQTASESIPLDKDPNDPFLGRAERLQRQEALIRDRLAQRRQRLEGTRQQAAGQSRQTSLQPGDKKGPSRPPAATPATPATPANPTPAGAKRGKGKSALVLPSKSMFPSVTFYLSPASVVVPTGARFATSSGLVNPDRLTMDAVQVVLCYPPDMLEPIAIHQDLIRPRLAAEPEALLDRQFGRLSYRGQLAKPIDGVELPLVTVEWKALRPTELARIRTGDGEQFSGAFQHGKFLSRTSLGVEEAQLDATVRVQRPHVGLPDGMRFFETAVSQGDGPSPRLPRLWIDQPAEGELEPGQWLVIDIGIENPDGVPIDEVRLAGRFDPQAVEIPDVDQGNWIDRDRNLLDGPFKTLWPWDLHYVNRVDQSRGVFYYRMGALKPIVHPSAPVARLFAHIKQPAQAPIIRWIWNGGADVAQPQTTLLAMNQNLYAGHLSGPRSTQTALADGLFAGQIEGYEKAAPRFYRF
jgi:hypothetical protein